MNVTSINQASGNLPVKQSKQDNHEKNIEQQITRLQEQMRNITYDNEMPAEEKDNEKKSLQEKIQSLNSELKQYQIRKRQEEAEKRQEETKRQDEESQKQKEAAAQRIEAEAQKAATASDSNVSTTASDTVSDKKTSENINFGDNSADTLNTQSESGFSDAESDAMISFSNTKEHLAAMQKLYTSLEGQMRTAPTDAEKADIQKKLDNVSKSMGEKIQKATDIISDIQDENEKRKEKIREKMKEFAEKKQNINAVVSNPGKDNTIDYGYWQKNAASLGKVLITHKKS